MVQWMSVSVILMWTTNQAAKSPKLQLRKHVRYKRLYLVTYNKLAWKEQNFKQAGDLYRSYTTKEKDDLIMNLAADLGSVKI